MRKLIIICCLLLSFKSQSQIKLTGKIISDINAEPIPNATVQIGQISGGYSDSTGHFSITINKPTVSKLIAQSLGFGKLERIITLKNDTSVVIKLTPLVYQLREVVVAASSQPKIESLGISKEIRKAKSNWCFTGFKTISQNAIFIKNEARLKGIIKSVRVFIGRGGKSKSAFRLRLYKVDQLTNLPGNDLSGEVLEFSARNNNWYEVNLLDKNILLPMEGFFLAFEWLKEDEDSKRCYTPNGKDCCYGPTLGLVSADNIDSYNFFLTSGGWQKQRYFPQFPSTPMMGCDILLLND